MSFDKTILKNENDNKRVSYNIFPNKKFIYKILNKIEEEDKLILFNRDSINSINTFNTLSFQYPFIN